MGTANMEYMTEVSQKFRTELPYETTVSLLAIYPKDLKARTRDISHPRS